MLCTACFTAFTACARSPVKKLGEMLPLAPTAFFLVKDVEPVGARALHPQNTTRPGPAARPSLYKLYVYTARGIPSPLHAERETRVLFRHRFAV